MNPAVVVSMIVAAASIVAVFRNRSRGQLGAEAVCKVCGKTAYIEDLCEEHWRDACGLCLHHDKPVYRGRLCRSCYEAAEEAAEQKRLEQEEREEARKEARKETRKAMYERTVHDDRLELSKRRFDKIMYDLERPSWHPLVVEPQADVVAARREQAAVYAQREVAALDDQDIEKDINEAIQDQQDKVTRLQEKIQQEKIPEPDPSAKQKLDPAVVRLIKEQKELALFKARKRELESKRHRVFQHAQQKYLAQFIPEVTPEGPCGDTFKVIAGMERNLAQARAELLNAGAALQSISGSCTESGGLGKDRCEQYARVMGSLQSVAPRAKFVEKCVCPSVRGCR